MTSDRPPGFTGSPIDRADRLRLDETELSQLAGSYRARLLRLAGHDPVLDDTGRLGWDSMADHGAEEMIFLGLDGDIPLFAPLGPVETGKTAGGLFHLLSQMEPRDAALWGGARTLIEWHNRHGFCPRCGSATVPFRAGWGRRCGACGAEHFPRVDPVVIMLAEHEGRVLVGRQPQYPPRRYSALAGFIEPGESLEEAVAREIREEAGIQVGNVRYVASQPWPFPGQLMIGCLAEAESDAITLDTNELEHAMWVDRAAVEAALRGDSGAPFEPPPHYAIAHTLLTRWLGEDADPLAPSLSPL